MSVLSGGNWDTSEALMNTFSSDADGNGGAALRRLLQYQPPAAIANPRVHGYVVTISFGLMLPLSIVISRCFKEYHPHWFHIHRVLGLSAWMVGVIGASFGQAILSSNPIPSYHQILGWLVVALSSLQISAIAFRPPLEHQYRWVWANFHQWSGRIGVAIAISNVYTGLHLAGEANKFFWGYSIILGTILLIGFCKEIIDIYHLGLMDHTSILVKVPKIKLMDEAEDDLEKAVDIEHKKRRSSIGGPEDGGFMFKNSQEYRRSVEMRRASLEAEDSFEKARPRRRSVEGPQDGGFMYRRSVEGRRSVDSTRRSQELKVPGAPRRTSVDSPDEGGFIFRRLSEEHRRSVEMRQGAHHGLPESETHHLTGGVPEDSILP